MNRLINIIVPLVLSASLLAIAGFVRQLAVQEGIKIAASEEAIEVVRASEQLAVEWSAEVARVKNTPDSNFDTLKDFVPLFTAGREDLLAALDRMGDVPKDLRNAVRSFTNRLEAKQNRIERFKTDHAVLRNSLDYLLLDPEGGRGLLRVAQQSETDEVEEATEILLGELGQFVRTPNNAWRERTRMACDHVVDVSAMTPTEFKAKEVARHVEVVLKGYRRAEGRFEDAISNQAISVAATALALRFRNDRERRQINLDYLDYGFYLVVGVMLAYWTYLAANALRRRSHGVLETGAEPMAEGPEQMPGYAPEVGYAGAQAEPEDGWEPTDHDFEVRYTGAQAEPEEPAEPEATDAEAYERQLIERLRILQAESGSLAETDAERIVEAESGERAWKEGGWREEADVLPVQGGAFAEMNAERPVEVESGGGAWKEDGQDTASVIEYPEMAVPAPAAATPGLPERPGKMAPVFALHVVAEAMAGKIEEFASELDRTVEAGGELPKPEAAETSPVEISMEALVALLDRLDGIRRNARLLTEEAGGMLEQRPDPNRRRTDLQAALTELLGGLDDERRGRVIATLLPGAFADVDRPAFQMAMERVLDHTLAEAARHPSGTGYVDFTLTTHEGRHCISCIEHGPGLAPGTSTATGDARIHRDTLNLDIARRLIVTQGGDFEIAAYPPHGSLTRIWLFPAM